MFFKSKSSPLLDSSSLAQLSELIAPLFNVSPDVCLRWLSATKEYVQIALPFADQSAHSQIMQVIQASTFASKLQAKQIQCEVNIQAKQSQQARLPKIKNMLAVASGKGGVGKSATSVNLAYALLAEGAKVGLLDADIYGPSLPIMLGNKQAQPERQGEKHMLPLSAHGLVTNSIGYLVPEENATVWRGPMASRALQQLLNETLWPELDYLIVDMPPGTGDIQLTLAQQMPVTAAIVVTTPQNLALADATKAVSMFDKVNVPVLGLVENMSYHQCENCGHISHIFAQGGAEKLADANALPLLGQIPLDVRVREHADGGEPLLVSAPEHPISQAYTQIARKLSRELALSEEFSDDNRIDIVQQS